jgi:hypothetical protein
VPKTVEVDFKSKVHKGGTPPPRRGGRTYKFGHLVEKAVETGKDYEFNTQTRREADSIFASIRGYLAAHDLAGSISVATRGLDDGTYSVFLTHNN